MIRSRWCALASSALLAATTVVTTSAATSTAAPVRYESESATISQGEVESNHAGFTGTGFVNKIKTTAATANGGPNADSLTIDRISAAATPVGINGQVHVCGTKLCNQYDKPIQLRGMSTHGI
jgi:hypothetical protein